MQQSRYFVVRKDEEWVIKFQDDVYGPYQSQSEAMLFAIEAAQKLGARGENPEVCVMGANGNFHPEWAYDRDTPPRI